MSAPRPARRGDPQTAPHALVTGGTGCVGAPLVRRLSEAGWRVTVWSRRPIPDRALAHLSNVRHAAVDLAREVPPLPSAIDVVVHLAALVHVPGLSAAAFERPNVDVPATLASAARSASARAFVLASTIAVYGERIAGVAESAPPQPGSPYARAKLRGEIAVRNVLAGSGTRLAVARLATVFGPGDRGNVRRLISGFARRRCAYPARGHRKSLVSSANAARALEFLIDAEVDTVVNVADRAVTASEIVDRIRARVPTGGALALPPVAVAACRLLLAAPLMPGPVRSAAAAVVKMATETTVATERLTHLGLALAPAADDWDLAIDDALGAGNAVRR